MASPKAEDLYQLLLTAKQQNNDTLTKELWLSTAQKFLDDSHLSKPKRPVTSSHKSMGDGDWIAYLEGLQHLQGVDIKKEIGKCQFWCSANGVLPTRKRVTNWLNSDRCTRTIGYQAHGQSSFAPRTQVPDSIPEPEGWKDEFPDFIRKDTPWPKLSKEDQKTITSQMQKVRFQGPRQAVPVLPLFAENAFRKLTNSQ